MLVAAAQLPLLGSQPRSRVIACHRKHSPPYYAHASSPASARKSKQKADFTLFMLPATCSALGLTEAN